MPHALIINHNAGTPYHGPNFRSYYAALGWNSKGIQTTIVCSSFSHKLKKFPRVDNEYAIEMIDGIRFVWIKTPAFTSNIGRLSNYVWFRWRLNILYDIIKEPVDYVVCSSPPPFWIWFCRRFAMWKGASLIFEARDLWPDVIFETTRFGFLNPAAWYMRAAEIAAYKHAHSVVSVNESAIQIMQKRGLTPDRFYAIPNGVSINPNDISGILPESAILCDKLKEEGKFIVGYAGALSKVYGLYYLSQAAQELQNENVAFVLAGTGDYEKELKKIAKRIPNLHLVGWVRKEQLNAFLATVDICFAGLLNVPSFAFGSDSTKIYEYMKASKPILHAIGNEDSAVVKAQCGLRVPPEDSKALVKGIKDLATRSEGELSAMGRRGLEYLFKYRNYEALTKKWLQLFTSLDGKKYSKFNCKSVVSHGR